MPYYMVAATVSFSLPAITQTSLTVPPKYVACPQSAQDVFHRNPNGALHSERQSRGHGSVPTPLSRHSSHIRAKGWPTNYTLRCNPTCPFREDSHAAPLCRTGVNWASPRSRCCTLLVIADFNLTFGVKYWRSSEADL